MAEIFINLLESIAADPDQPIGQLNLLSHPERKTFYSRIGMTPKGICFG
jgi:hypothetical protein